MIDLGAFVNKTVDFAYRGKRLSLDLSHALFSSNDVDVGTRLLLKELASDQGIQAARSVLDVGCGVGVIGAALAAANPAVRVVLRDRDLLACAFAERNCLKNGISVLRLGLETREGTGPGAAPSMEGAPRVLVAPGLLAEADPFGPYDAVVSNLPAKAGAEVLGSFVAAAAGGLLKPGGRLAFVLVNSLAPLAPGWALAAGLEPRGAVQGAGHSVFVFGKAQIPAGEGAEASARDPGIGPETRGAPADPYLRTRGVRELGGYRIDASGYRGLPEFDTNAFATDLGIEALAKAAAGSLVRDLLLVEPGIGLPALWAASCLGPERIHALSRDLLSLVATEANLRAAYPTIRFLPGSVLEPETAPEHGIDAALVFPDLVPRVDPAPLFWALASRCLKRGAQVVLVANSAAATAVDRAKPKGFARRFDKRRKGLGAIAYLRD